MKLLSRTEFADIYLSEEGEPCVVKRYRKSFGDEAHFLKVLGGLYTPRLYKSDADSITIEYIDGVELGVLVASGGAGFPAARLSLIQTIAYVYSFFHDNGVLHMDPKPDNIFVRRNGTIKVIDFQLATSVENPVVHMSDEGIPYYWYNVRPPESFRKDFKPSIKGEIYALGHLFYYILRGHFLCEEFLGIVPSDSPGQYPGAPTREKIRGFHEKAGGASLKGGPIVQLIGKMISPEERGRPESMNAVVHTFHDILHAQGGAKE